MWGEDAASLDAPASGPAKASKNVPRRPAPANLDVAAMQSARFALGALQDGVALSTLLSSPAMRTLRATRYVTPLREGGSLPAIVEAEDDGLYVLKFRAAGHGVKALIAELLCG